jgi:hypothetical protein
MIATPAAAVTPREILIAAAFDARDKASAMDLIQKAYNAATAVLARNPGDRDAQIIQAMAAGYSAKLSRNRKGALAAKAQIEKLAQTYPRDAEAQIVLAGWHLDAIAELGGLMARAVVGANRTTGIEALDRAVALDSRRAAAPAIAALMRIRLNSSDVAHARQLAETAMKADAPTLLDVALQKRAALLLVPLRAGDGKKAAALAETLLPFGRLKG